MRRNSGRAIGTLKWDWLPIDSSHDALHIPSHRGCAIPLESRRDIRLLPSAIINAHNSLPLFVCLPNLPIHPLSPVRLLPDQDHYGACPTDLHSAQSPNTLISDETLI